MLEYYSFSLQEASTLNIDIEQAKALIQIGVVYLTLGVIFIYISRKIHHWRMHWLVGNDLISAVKLASSNPNYFVKLDLDSTNPRTVLENSRLRRVVHYRSRPDCVQLEVFSGNAVRPQFVLGFDDDRQLVLATYHGYQLKRPYWLQKLQASSLALLATIETQLIEWDS